MSSHPSLIVTTSRKASVEVVARAQRQAADWSLPFVDRGDAAMENLLDDHDAAMVFENAGLHLATATGRLRFHLGTAFIRLKSIERGESDPLERAAELRSGDAVLDTTFGLGRDSMVAARIVGPSGSVVAFEASPALVHLANAGLPQLAESTWGPITVRLAEAYDALRTFPDASVDVVLIDPMFAIPKTSDAGFEVLRGVAHNAPLDQQWISEARRVARRWVVVKAGETPPWHQAEALERVHSHSNATWWRAPAH